MATRDITYDPINTESRDIRLLRLSDRSVQGLPFSEILRDRRFEGGPVCEIFHASLDDGVRYEALSYAWGDAEKRKTIMVNGSPTSVTINLARALEDIRLDVGTRIMWVDALCIDQNNTVERNHQVRQMGSIYRKAEKVLAWVGRPNAKNRRSQSSILDSWQEMEHHDQAQYYTDNPDLRAKWLSMASFCELPYWHRLWIVQEVGLASELWVYHGRSCRTWKQFSELRKVAQNMKSLTATHGTLRGIAATISDGLPGRLDQQMEYQQPHWLKELHDTIQCLLSRAEAAAKGTWILHEVFRVLKCRRSRNFPTIGDSAQNLLLSSSKSKASSYFRESITSVYFRAGNFAAQMDEIVSEEELELLPDEQSKSPLVMDYEAQISIYPFLPLDTNVAEALKSLPRHIKPLREHEREQYEKEMNEKRDVIRDILSRTLCDKIYTGSMTAERFANFPTFSPIGTISLGPRKLKNRAIEEDIIRLPPSLHTEERDLRREINERKRNAKPNVEESEHDSGKTQNTVLQLESRNEQIQKLKRKIKYMNDRYREIEDYLQAWRALLRSLVTFARNLATEIDNHQPAFLLRTLLETCERSLCQNPRDKVYALLGLASNIEENDLQVDYSKSMFDLFWDVVWLTYKQESIHTRDIDLRDPFETELIRFSQLLQRSLGGPFPTDEFVDEREKDTETNSRPVVQLPGYVVGTILLLDFGDGLSESNLYQNQIEILKQYFRGQRSQESLTDTVTSVLDQLKDANQDLLTPITGIHAWSTKKIEEQDKSPHREMHSRAKKARNSHPVLFVESSGLTGLAPYNVRSDDLLVQFSNCDIAAIIRPSADNEDEYIVVGRAVVARRFDEKRKAVSDSSPELFQYAVPSPQSLLVDKMVWLELDAETLQKLTCPVTEKREYNFDVLAV